MITLLLPIALVVAAVVAYRRHRDRLVLGAGPSPGSRAAGRITGSRDERTAAFARLLGEWRDAGLLQADEVEPILRYEAAKAAPHGRVPLAAEAVGYVGLALVLAAIAVFTGQHWDALAVGARVAVLAVPAVGAAVFGWWAGAQPDRAFVRLGSIAWVLATALLAGAATVVWVDVVHGGDPPEHGGPLFVAAVTLAWALPAYRSRRLLLQEAAMLAVSFVVAFGLFDLVEPWRDDAVAGGLLLIVAGAVCGALGVTHRLGPDELPRLAGPAAMLLGAQTLRTDALVTGLWLGLALSAVLLAVGVWRADVLVLLAGTAGLFQWAPQIATHYLADTLGTAATLFVVGVLLLAAAATFARLYRRVTAGPPASPPLAP